MPPFAPSDLPSLPRRVGALWQDGQAALRHEGPVSFPRLWSAELEDRFPGPRRLTEQWVGEGASFARYQTARHGPLFLKYLPAGEREGRYYRRFTREISYLRELAPLIKVPHAPLLHAAQHKEQRRAHLLTPDLTETTWGWGHFPEGPQQVAALRDVARLLAQFHSAWRGHPALEGQWQWQPRYALSEAEVFAQLYRGPHAEAVRQAAAQLPELLRGTAFWALVHGDIHSGQVLWPRDGSPPLLIDYGQVHAGIPGEDLAHLLAVRLTPEERAQYGAGVREAYWAEVALRGARLGEKEMRLQERAGVALNLLTLVQQTRREPHEGLQRALSNVVATWEELSQ